MYFHHTVQLVDCVVNKMTEWNAEALSVIYVVLKLIYPYESPPGPHNDWWISLFIKRLCKNLVACLVHQDAFIYLIGVSWGFQKYFTYMYIKTTAGILVGGKQAVPGWNLWPSAGGWKTSPNTAEEEASMSWDWSHSDSSGRLQGLCAVLEL